MCIQETIASYLARFILTLLMKHWLCDQSSLSRVTIPELTIMCWKLFFHKYWVFPTDFLEIFKGFLSGEIRFCLSFESTVFPLCAFAIQLQNWLFCVLLMVFSFVLMSPVCSCLVKHRLVCSPRFPPPSWENSSFSICMNSSEIPLPQHCQKILAIRQFKHQTLFATQTQTQYNLIMNTNPMCRICHTPLSHWLRNLGYVPFELTLQFTFGA